MTEPKKPDETPKTEELTDEELENVSGGLATTDIGRRPAPGGPVPIPYPNIATTTKS